jgi:membrane-associated phospholipid phosphatase
MESVGDCFQVAVPLYALCLIWEREGHKEALRFALGFLIMTAAVTVLKQIIPDERPDYSPGNEKDSLPSRHTASAFFGAFAIHRRYGYKRAIIPYALSVFTGFSRVAAGRHFTHDVIVTAVALGLISWRFLKPRR